VVVVFITVVPLVDVVFRTVTLLDGVVLFCAKETAVVLLFALVMLS